MVAEIDHGILAKQRPLKVDVNECKPLPVQEYYDARFPLGIDDYQITYATGEPGEEIGWHTHMPGHTQVHYIINGSMKWEYKDNNGDVQSLVANAGEVVYLPGGFQNRVEIVGDEYHEHIGVLKNDRVIRVEQLLGTAAGKYTPQEDIPYGVLYDEKRGEIIDKDENAFIETP